MVWERPERDHRRLGRWRFELRGDELADLRFDDGRVLRSIRAVVRDRDWDTAGLVVEGIESGPDAITLRVRSDGLGSSLRGTVRATAAGEQLTVAMDLVSADPFPTNRTGLVVLHPPGVAGAPLVVRHRDGTVRTTVFPEQISPHQPATGIAALEWRDGSHRIAVRFEGDTFEMEDQRNWSDASFKTYSRPLALPFPYQLAAGERVTQSVTVTATALPRTGRVRPTADEIRLTPEGPFPEVSTSAATAPDPGPAPAPGGNLVVELDLAWPGWPAALRRAASSGRPLDVRLVLPDSGPAAALSAAVAALRPHRIARIAAFWASGPARHVCDAEATDMLRSALAAAGLRAPVTGGVRSHFTELNREQHRLATDLDGVVFALTPLFHSLDTEQAVESVAVQRLIARQAVRLAAGAPVFVGPITLRPHFNDVATTPPRRPSFADLREGYGPHLSAGTDPRQAAPELAAWTVASAAALSVPGVAGLSYFEDWGPRGLRDGTGDDLPAARAVAALAALGGSTALTGDSPDGLVWALGGMDAVGATTVYVANLDHRARVVDVVISDRRATITLDAYAWGTVATPTTRS